MHICRLAIMNRSACAKRMADMARNLKSDGDGMPRSRVDVTSTNFH